MPNYVKRILRGCYDILAIRFFRTVTIAGVRLDVRGLSLRMRSVLFRQQYESCETRLCRQFVRPGDSVLELGAGIGFIGLFCLKQLQVTRVLSVEANPRSVTFIRRNYALNGFSAEVVCAAAASSDGTAELITGRDFWADRVVVSAHTKSRSNQSLTIRAATLRSLFELAAQPFTVLIIDIEGSETELDWSSVPQSVRLIILEIHPDLLGASEVRRVVERIAHCGFQEAGRLGDVVAFARV